MIQDIVFGPVEFCQEKHVLFLADHESISPQSNIKSYLPVSEDASVDIREDIEPLQSIRIENKTFEVMVMECYLRSDWIVEILKENLDRLVISNKDAIALVLPKLRGNVDPISILQGISASKYSFCVYHQNPDLDNQALLDSLNKREVEMLRLRVR